MLIWSMKICLIVSCQNTNDGLTKFTCYCTQPKHTEKVVPAKPLRLGLSSNFDALTFLHVVVSWLLVKSSDGYKIRIKLREGKEINSFSFYSLSHIWLELTGSLHSTHHNMKECLWSAKESGSTCSCWTKLWAHFMVQFFCNMHNV